MKMELNEAMTRLKKSGFLVENQKGLNFKMIGSDNNISELIQKCDKLPFDEISGNIMNTGDLEITSRYIRSNGIKRRIMWNREEVYYFENGYRCVLSGEWDSDYYISELRRNIKEALNK